MNGGMLGTTVLGIWGHYGLQMGRIVGIGNFKALGISCSWVLGIWIFVGLEGLQFSRDLEVGSSFNSRDFTVGEF
jgi:hypothetical protein